MTSNKAILLTCGMKESSEYGGWKPDLDGHMRANAAARLYERGHVDKIIVAGGKLDGENNPSLAEVMKNYLVKKYKVSPEHIETENDSIDTIENADNVRKDIR